MGTSPPRGKLVEPAYGGRDIGNALYVAGTAVGDWWSSPSWLDKLDMAMTIIGFIPGIDVVSDAYFLGRAIIDVAQGRGDWGDVAMAVVGLASSLAGESRTPRRSSED